MLTHLGTYHSEKTEFLRQMCSRLRLGRAKIERLVWLKYIVYHSPWENIRKRLRVVFGRREQGQTT